VNEPLAKRKLMQTDENIEKIRERLEGAFKPFRCVAEILITNRSYASGFLTTMAKA
jgi:hypothetical protein